MKQISETLKQSVDFVKKIFPEMRVISVVDFDDGYVFNLVPKTGGDVYIGLFMVQKGTNKIKHFNPMFLDNPKEYFDAVDKTLVLLGEEG